MSAAEHRVKRTRIKESCTSCRRMKSKCDGKKPCLPCQLRNQTAACEYASQTSQPITQASSVEPERPNLPSLDNHEWIRLQRALPSWTTCEILLEYGIQEIDWMWLPSVRIVDIWHQAIRIQMCSATQAGLMAMSLAMPALCIAYHRPALYRPDIQPDLHLTLARLARSFLPRVINTLDELELLLQIADYLGYRGDFSSVYEGDFGEIETGAPLVATAMRMGLFDETLPSWNVSRAETEQRRKLSSLVVRLINWATLMRNTPSLLEGVTVNVCRPDYAVPSLDKPVRLSTSEAPGFRMFRHKSQEEHNLLVAVHETCHELFSTTNDIRLYLRAIEDDPCFTTSHQVIGQANRLCSWLRSMKGRLGPLDNIEYTDPLSCKVACHRICYEMIIRHMMSILLHPWMLSQWSSKTQEFVTMAQANICETDRLSGIIRRLFHSRHASLPVPLQATFLWSQVMSLIVWRSKLGPAMAQRDMINYSEIGYPEVWGQTNTPTDSPSPGNTPIMGSRAELDSIDAMFSSAHETLELLSIAPFAAVAAERVGRIIKRIQVDKVRTAMQPPENDQWMQVTLGNAHGEVFRDMWDVNSDFWKFL